MTVKNLHKIAEHLNAPINYDVKCIKLHLKVR